jgi:hypothetical protein
MSRLEPAIARDIVSDLARRAIKFRSRRVTFTACRRTGVWPVLFILVFSFFAWSPLLTPAYFFGAHDAPHSVFFLVEFDQTLGDGYLWPRWSPDFAFGYGYPLFNIYAPLAFYAAEMLHLLGFGFVGAVKFMYMLATVGAGLAMYGFVSRLLGRQAGLLASVVYMLAPFHLLEMYVRSAYPEFVALALFPLILWAFTDLVAQPTPRRTALAGLAYGLLALTHHTSLLTFTPFLAAYVAFLLIVKWCGHGKPPYPVAGSLAQDRQSRYGPLKTALAVLASTLLGLGLAAIYLIPMVLELRYVKIEQWTAYSYDFRQHFVYLAQLLSPDWGYGYSGPGLHDEMSFQLGAVIVMLVIFGGWLVLTPSAMPYRRGEKWGTGDEVATARSVPRGTILFFLAATLAIIWLMSPAAEFAWQVLPIASLVQFPWRLLGLTALTVSVVAAAVYPLATRAYGTSLPRVAEGGDSSSPRRYENSSPVPATLYILCLVVALGSFAYTLPQYTQVEDWRESPLAVVRWDQFSPADRVAMVTYTDQQPTSGPMEAQYIAGQPLQVATILKGTGTVQTLRHGGASDEVLVRAETPVTVQFYTYDYPGWQVTVGREPLVHRHEPPYGLITVDVPAGEHHLALRMGTTPPRIAGGIISLVSVALCLVLFLKKV